MTGMFDELWEEFDQPVKQNPQEHINNDSIFKVKLLDDFEYYISVERKAKDWQYKLLNGDKEISKNTNNKSPDVCNKTTQFVKDFIKTIKSDTHYDESYITSNVMGKLTELQHIIDDYDVNKEKISAQTEESRNQEHLKQVEENYHILCDLLKQSGNTIIDYMQLCITNMVNGENKNVLMGALCHLSTYFKMGALWFMVVGRSNEGKSEVANATLKLLPSNASTNGRMTESALLRTSREEGRDFIDGKIMVLQDLGGEHDFKKYEDILNIYKQLSTDGKVEHKLTCDSIDKETGEKLTDTLVLDGHCSVCFTTVKTEDIDEQYFNRGRVTEPDSTDDHIASHKKYYQGVYKQTVDTLVSKYVDELLHGYIEYIRLNYSEVIVFNPYLTCLMDWLKEDAYFKRSSGQYIKLVETITLLNYPFREKLNDGKYVVSTKEDNEIIGKLFQPNYALSPQAIRLFNKLIDWYYCADNSTTKLGVLKYSHDCTAEEYEKTADKELDNYSRGSIGVRDFKAVFTHGQVNRKRQRIKDLLGVDVSGILGNLVKNGYIGTTDVKAKGTDRNVYRLIHFDKITPKQLEFNDECIKSYIEDVVPETFPDIDYELPCSSDEYKSIVDDDELKKTVIGDLKCAKWF